MNYESWIMSASLNSYSFLIKHNRFIVYLINGNFCYNIQYILLYTVSCSCTTSCIDNLSKTKCLVFSESGCKGTAFFWHDQIFKKVFCIFFVTRWLSATTFSMVKLNFLTVFHRTHTLVLPKAGAKLLLFSDMTKFLCTFFDFSS